MYISLNIVILTIFVAIFTMAWTSQVRIELNKIEKKKCC